MVPIFTDSFGSYQGDISLFLERWTQRSASWIFPGVSTDVRVSRWGKSYLQLSSDSNSFCYKNLDLSYSYVCLCTSFIIYKIPSATTHGSICQFSHTTNGGVSYFEQLHVSYTINREIVVLRGSTELARSAPNVFNYEQWFTVSAKIKFDTGSSGQICINIFTASSNTVINVSGVTTAINASAMSRFYMGATTGGDTGNTPTNMGGNFAGDLVLYDATGSALDSFPGEHRVEYLKPVANGSLSQWVGSDGNSTDNYSLFNSGSGTTTFITSATTGDTDSYVFNDITWSIDSVVGLSLLVRAKKSDAGGRTVKTAIYNGSAADISTLGFGTVIQTLDSISTINPLTSAAYTKAEVNAAEFRLIAGA